MRLSDDTTLKQLQAMVGKRGKFKTPRGYSMPHIIERIELIGDDVILTLRSVGRPGRVRLRRIARFELDNQSDIKPEVAVARRKRIPTAIPDTNRQELTGHDEQ